MDHHDLFPLPDGTAMPTFGFGCYVSKGGDIAPLVTSALETGYRCLDCAAKYGNESGVGQGIRDSGLSREEVYLISKVWPTDFEQAAPSVEQSLRDLNTDYLDCCLLHWPCTDESRRFAAWEQLLELRERGKLRSVGVSNFLPRQIAELTDKFGVVPVLNEVELHPLYQQSALRDFCAQRGIAVVAYSPIKRGEALEGPVFSALAEKYGKTPGQIALRWHHQLGNIPIPNTSRPERIRENFNIFDFALTPQEMAAIAALDCGGNRGKDPLLYDGD